MSKTKKLVIAAMFAALACVATLLIHIPTPTKGYVNLGDAIVLLGGFMLGPVYGGLAAGIGTALADLILGYTIYIPATFVIKFLVAMCAGFIYHFADRSIIKMIIAGAVSELIMIAGYFLFECLLVDGGLGIAVAATGIIGNAFQALCGIVISAVLCTILGRVKEIDRFLK